MIHGYPYTDFHELNLDYILKLARSSMGLHLEQSGKFLKLVNAQGEEISKLQIYYAQTALQDVIGNNIDAYIIRGSVDGDNVILTRGNGEYISLTIPYAVKAKTDVNNVDLTSYIHGLSISGNNLLITYGNGNTYTVTVPYAVKASEDVNGKSLTTYVAEITTGNDKLIIKDGDNNILSEITVPYAVKASNDDLNESITATYGALLTTDVTTISLRSKDNTILSTITVPYAVKALSDNAGNEFLTDYGYHLGTNGNKVTLDAHDGSTLNEITVPFSVLATDATNAIEQVQISGDEIVFTTYGGVSTRITVPYAVKALKDNLNNTLSNTYIANAINDPLTGKITFYAQDGSIIAEMIPTVDSAVHDGVGNVIADFVKTIVTDPNSNYVTVTHGTGVTDTLTINYATKAWKDTYDNVIGNTYIRRLACEVDVDTAHYMLLAYNGELSELFRIELRAYMAQVDINEKDLTTYVAGVTVDGSDATIINITDGNGNILNSISGTVTTTPTGTISGTGVTLDVTTDTVEEITDVGTLPTTNSKTVLTGFTSGTDTVDEIATVGTLPSASYDANTQTVIFSAGTLPTTNTKTVVTSLSSLAESIDVIDTVGTLPTTNTKTVVTAVSVDTITEPVFTGDSVTNDVDFND